jgi:hypothetical protein
MSTTTWAVVAGLGVYHGLNPAMGWLFAVALGLQERRWSAVLRALPPIALGHMLSVTVVVAVVAWAGALIPVHALRLAGALMLLGFAVLLATRHVRHPRTVGMRPGARELALWSFIMASAHGSGLMLLPVLLRTGSAGDMAAHGAHIHVNAGISGDRALVLFVHTTAMFVALGAAALLSYRVLGLAFLRRAWLNLDAIWITALGIAAGATLLIR